jgi:MFS superfamily sulfate permease-like transporter
MTGIVLPRHSVSSEPVGGLTSVIAASGELTFSAVGDLELAIEERVADGCVELVLDLTGVTAVRPSAEIVLRQLRARLADHGCEVAVAAAAPGVVASLATAGLIGEWPVAPTRTGALAELLSRPVA